MLLLFSVYSEISDVDSEILSTAPGQKKLRKETQKRSEKAWLAAKELVDSERRYVEKLKLLGEVSEFWKILHYAEVKKVHNSKQYCMTWKLEELLIMFARKL